MLEIIPALMPKSFSELREKLELVSGLVSTIQLDVMDGIFVPPKSWPYSEDVNILDELIRDEVELPGWQDINFEVDLMVQNPEQIVDKWLCVGVSRVIIHIESTENLADIVTRVESNVDRKNTAGDDLYRVELGFAMDIDTPNESMYEWVPQVDFVQCMGIAKIGYQGNPFDERVVSKIKDLKDCYPDVIIQVDGGVSLDTAQQLIEAGAARLVSGSAIWKSGNVEDAIRRLQHLTNNQQPTTNN